MMKVGIILAAGKGKRFNSKGVNKTAATFNGKPLLEYALDLFSSYCDKVVVVVGAYSDSLRDIVSKYPNAVTAFQSKRLGTGHAVKIAVEKIKEKGWDFDTAFVGYGDHMMFYTVGDLEEMEAKVKEGYSLCLLTCKHDPEKLAWGRIIRDHENHVVGIVEEKVATPEQKLIDELNPGFYCLDYKFLEKGVFKIAKTEGGEQYFTDIVAVANEMGKKVSAVVVPFEHVGFGINTREEIIKGEQLLKEIHQ